MLWFVLNLFVIVMTVICGALSYWWVTSNFMNCVAKFLCTWFTACGVAILYYTNFFALYA